MSPQSYRLVMQTGPNPGKVLDLASDEVVMGRDTNNEFVINDSEVSRKHARISVHGGTYILEDLGSTNGTFIEGQRLMGPHTLRPGDLILLGENVSVRFEASTFDPDATMVSPQSPMTIPAGMPPFGEEPLPPYQPAYPEQPMEPMFSDPIMPGPFEVEAPPLPPRKKSRTGLAIVIVLIVLVLCLCVPLLVGAYFAPREFWCTVLPFLFAGCQ